MNALFTIFALLGLVLCASAQFGFGPGFHGHGPVVTKTIVTESRPGFGRGGFNNGFGPRGFNNGFNGGFNRGPGFHGPHGGFNNGFGGPSTITRTITTFNG